MAMYASTHRNTSAEIRGVSSESRNAEKVAETNRTVNDVRSEILKLKIMVQAMMELMVEQGIDPSLINAKIDEISARPKTFEQPEKETKPCPKCHKQLRADGGCSHCERAELLSGELKRISVNQAKSVLSEPVTVENPTGATFRFTNEKLLGDSSHLKADHTDADFARRARVMLYGIDAAKTSRDIENKQASQPNELGVYAQRKEVRKSYTDKETGKRFEVVVRADRDGEVFDVFDIFPR